MLPPEASLFHRHILFVMNRSQNMDRFHMFICRSKIVGVKTVGVKSVEFKTVGVNIPVCRQKSVEVKSVGVNQCRSLNCGSNSMSF